MQMQPQYKLYFGLLNFSKGHNHTKEVGKKYSACFVWMICKFAAEKKRNKGKIKIKNKSDAPK